MKVLLVLSVILAGSYASPSSRIAGGSTTDIAYYPFSTSLLRLQDNSYRHQCGGTIISRNAILSAASCFITGTVADEPVSWRARIGSTFSNRLGLIHMIKRITTHPGYLQTTRVNDVAVLRATIDFTYGNTVQASYLAGGAYSLPGGTALQAIGWGSTSATGSVSAELRNTTIWVIEQETCANRYNALNFAVTDNMVCAGWAGVGIRGQCQGDTGSPLLHNNVVVGVFSWSEGCADPQYPGINTKVSSYARWIEATAVAA
ncbi:unnamed protein product [Leptosia nina]|uniref:Peptidase S1 domain-containing protein n=1 Tax=Leptosia nina TaxID=320188 RepID=A0AAV1JAK5_9NEOP